MQNTKKAETFRRNKLLNWIKLQNKISDGLINSNEEMKKDVAIRTLLMDELREEFNISMDEIKD